MKYKLHEIVKIKRTGEKVKIHTIYIFEDGQIWYNIKEKATSFRESELKPYRPSRAGVRGKDGRFVSKKEYTKSFYGWTGYAGYPSPEKIEKPYTHEKNSSKENILFSKIIELIDAHYALEERVKELEKKI